MVIGNEFTAALLVVIRVLSVEMTLLEWISTKIDGVVVEMIGLFYSKLFCSLAFIVIPGIKVEDILATLLGPNIQNLIPSTSLED